MLAIFSCNDNLQDVSQNVMLVMSSDAIVEGC